MRKLPVVFIKENETEVCKKTNMTLHELSKVIAMYQVYMMGTSFVITKDYDKIKVKEKAPEDFTERIGVSQTVMMYRDLKGKINNER